MIDAPVKRLIPWYGSKATLGKTIARQLGPHRQFFDPCCGSMAVLLTKKQASFETVNDMHGDLVNLARVLQLERTAVELYGRVDRFLFCEPAIDSAIERIRVPLHDELDPASPTAVDRAVDYFVVSWTARNGMAGLERPDFQIAVRWNTGGGSPTTRFRSAVDSVPAWHRRLQGVTILRRDAFAIIPKFADDADTAVYLDPTYIPDGETRTDTGAVYQHEFRTKPTTIRAAAGTLFADCDADDDADDHDRLAELLRRFKRARVVVSYYDVPRVRELYAGWTFIDCTRGKHLKRWHGDSTALAHEVLIVNGEAF